MLKQKEKNKLILSLKEERYFMIKIFIGSILAITVVGIYFSFCLLFIASSNNISEEDYRRMAQEIVKQSLKPMSMRASRNGWNL